MVLMPPKRNQLVLIHQTVVEANPHPICSCHQKFSELVTTYQNVKGAALPPALSTSPRDISAGNSADPKVGDAYSHAMCSMQPKVVQTAISHQILRHANSPPADSTRTCIREQPCIEWWEIQTHILCSQWHQEMYQPATIYQILRDPD
jgi:hypothetical protein